MGFIDWVRLGLAGLLLAGLTLLLVAYWVETQTRDRHDDN
jgi:hypothetical protein